MGQGIGYPLNDNPVDDDQLLGIDDPEGTWSIQRFSIGVLLSSVRDRLEALEIALRENQIYPGEIVFTTNGQTFEPTIIIDGEATVEWTFADGSTSSSTTPSVDFGSSGNRIQRLKVTPWSALYRINVGYSGQDGGPSTDEAGNTFEHVTSQPVTGIENLALVKDTLMYLCGCGCPITSVDVEDFTALYGIEFYGCDSLVSANIYGTSNLRRACFENSPVGFLDFSQSPLMEDVRGSYCELTEIRWGTTGQYLWHMCVRENSATIDPATWPDMTQFPVLQECWISGNGLTGALDLSSTVISSVWCYNNDHPSMDFSGCFPSGSHYVNAYNNPNCTTITIDNCPGLTTLNAAGCALTQTNVDYILATLDANGASGGTVDLSGGTSSAPSAAGLISQASLEGKGWTVTVNEPDVPLLSSATIGADGATWTLVFTEAVQFGAGGNGGFAVTMTNAGAVNLTYSSGVGSNTLVYTGDMTVQGDDTVASGLDYTQPGDGIENTSGYDLASFTGESVTNNSAVGPPALVSATLGSDGMTWTFVFNKAVNIGAGGSGGFAIEFTTAGVIGLTYGSGDGSTTLVYSGDTAVESTDTVASGLDYTQPGDGIEDGDGYDLASFTGHAIVNNSQIGPITLGDYAEGNAYDTSTSVTTDQSISWEAGDVVLVHAGWWSGDTTVTITDDSGQGNTYTAIAGSLVDETIHQQFFYCVMSQAGSGTVTLSTGGDSSYVSVRAMVFSNVDTTDPIDSSAASLTDTAQFSTNAANTVVVMGIHDDSGTTGRTVTPNTMTILFDQEGGIYRPIAYEIYEDVQTNVTATMSGGNVTSVSIVALKGIS